LSKLQESNIRNGQKISLDELKINDVKKKAYLANNKNQFMVCKHKNNIICFFELDGNYIKPTKVFNM
ncbi:MAG: hypothetical protein VXW84_13970, partial [Verrucomicrobiota bacterium]|nr:hypothetical protein [Verrucomicrobiota bacterium]